MQSNSKKRVNRYYQVECISPRGRVLGTVFFKADNKAQIMAQIENSQNQYRQYVENIYNQGGLSGKLYDNIATRFKVWAVCHYYAKAVAAGGFNLQRDFTKAEKRWLNSDVANYLCFNTLPYRAA